VLVTRRSFTFRLRS